MRNEHTTNRSTPPPQTPQPAARGDAKGRAPDSKLNSHRDEALPGNDTLDQASDPIYGDHRRLNEGDGDDRGPERPAKSGN